MKTKFKRVVGHAAICAGFVALSLVAVSAISLTGCGPKNPTEADLDRVPDVPPFQRGARGALGDPTQSK